MHTFLKQFDGSDYNIIVKYIKPEITVFCDEWKAYIALINQNYAHKSGNHLTLLIPTTQ